MAELPPDPDAEQRQALQHAFEALGFNEIDADLLACAWADPLRVSWWLQQGCSLDDAVKIAT